MRQNRFQPAPPRVRHEPLIRVAAPDAGIAFVANGLGPFGLKIMAEKGLSEKYHYQYLILWYAGGLLFGLAWFLWQHAEDSARRSL